MTWLIYGICVVVVVLAYWDGCRARAETAYCRGQWRGATEAYHNACAICDIQAAEIRRLRGEEAKEETP